MPHYDYDCAACGPFGAERRLADWSTPCPCPRCGLPAPRGLARPAFSGIDGGQRRAIEGNERARHEPARVSGGAHASGCGCCRPVSGAKRNAQSVAPKSGGTRPWMISH